MNSDLLLIVRLAGRRIAISAAEVEAVVELDAITPTPRTAPHVAGLAALRSRVLTVIDALASLELGRSEIEGAKEAIVISSGGHPYAILVETVEDVVEYHAAIAPLRAPVGPSWQRVAVGMVDPGDDILLLVDPHLIISGPATKAA